MTISRRNAITGTAAAVAGIALPAPASAKAVTPALANQIVHFRNMRETFKVAADAVWTPAEEKRVERSQQRRANPDPYLVPQVRHGQFAELRDPKHYNDMVDQIELDAVNAYREAARFLDPGPYLAAANRGIIKRRDAATKAAAAVRDKLNKEESDWHKLEAEREAAYEMEFNAFIDVLEFPAVTPADIRAKGDFLTEHADYLKGFECEVAPALTQAALNAAKAV